MIDSPQIFDGVGSALPPLADLHRHLDGSLRAATLAALAGRVGVELPADIRFVVGMGLDAALSRFATTLACLQTADAVARVADEMCCDAAAEGVTTLEIRFAPQLHHGAAMDRIIDAALEGIGGRAGLILCGLYGDPPSLVQRLVELGRGKAVGLDLAGGPSPGHRWGMLDYRDAFAAARAAGLGRTVHAGEGRPASEIIAAIEHLGAQRIGHGTTLLDDPRALELVVERAVVIEACPTSNVHTGVIAKVDDHPLPRWLSLGVRACLNADNTLLSDVTAADEYRAARRMPGMTPTLWHKAVEYGHRGAFPRG